MLLPLGLLSQGGGAGGVLANWMASLSSASSDIAYGVYYDASGNSFIAGNSGTNAYLAKLDSSVASISFQTSITNGTSAIFNGVASDATNVYVAGYTNNGTAYVALTAKYNSTGTLQWQRKLTAASNNAFAYGVAADSSGNVYICGQNYNTGFSLNGSFTAKYNTSGTLQWSASNGTSATETMWAVAVDGSGNVYSVGQRSSSGAVWQKFSSAGSSLASARLYSSGNEKFYGIAVDGSSNSYCIGYDGNTGYPMFNKYNSSGTLQWQRTLNGLNVTSQRAGVAVDSSGNSYHVMSYPNQTTYIVKYNTSGTIQWQRSLARTGGYVYATGIVIDSAGTNFIVSGLTDLNSNDIITFKFPVDGSKTGTYSLNSGSYVYATSALSESAGGMSTTTNGGGGSTNLTDAANTDSTGTPALTLTKVTV